MASDYPKRPGHFAHRFVRLLTKSCAAQTIGPEACWMLCIIAHQEDVLRYRRPPTYYNGQLMPLAGFDSDGRLIRARARAIEAGWLHYEAGGKRKPGVYWVQIPLDYDDLPDTPTEAGEDFTSKMHLQNGNRNERETKEKRNTNERETKCKRSANGNPPTLYPNTLFPSPIPKEDSSEPEIPASEPPFMVFPVVGGSREWLLSKDKLDEYRTTFPGIDVEAELRKACQWATDNQAKRKTARGMPAFLFRWLEKSQNRAGNGYPSRYPSKLEQADAENEEINRRIQKQLEAIR